MTLAEFLLARYDEDEAVAETWPDNGYWGLGPTGDGMWTDTQGRPIYAPKPRVLAECEAKRRIVDLADEATMLDEAVDSDRAVEPRNLSTDPYFGDVLLRALALPYVDHPDFREEWKA